MFIPKYIKATNFLSFKEMEFYFKNNKAILIQGKNLDDKSQRGNGSGKSSFIEAISFAASGTSMRDILAKELIMKGEKTGEVEWCLFNDFLGLELKVWRKLYANTKSAECRIWLNDVEKTDIPDVGEKTKFVFQTLGISKEDFYNFYLITSENNFVPFLKAGDTKKKEIINRFSGADKVDKVFPFIEADSALKQQEIDVIKASIANLQGRQQVLVEQQLAEEEKLSPEKQSEAMFQVKNKMVEIEGGISIKRVEISEQILPLLEIRREELAAWTYSKNYEGLLADANRQKSIHNENHQELTTKLAECKNLFQGEVNAVIKEETDLLEEKKQIRDTINEYTQFIDGLKNSLASSIECPSCQHKFVLRDKSFNVQEATDMLPESEKELAELKEQLSALTQKEHGIIDKKQAINQKVIAEQQKYREQLQKATEGSNEWHMKIVGLQQEQKEEDRGKRTIVEAIANIESNIRSIEADIALQQQKLTFQLGELDRVVMVDRSRIEDLEKQAIALIELEEVKETELEKVTSDKTAIDTWLFTFKAFKSHLANKSIKNIQDYTNLFLEMMGSNISIAMDGYRLLANKKLKEEISTTVQKDGFEVGSYGTFSRGERGRIDVCNVLGNQELINLNSVTGGLDMLLVDEVLDAVDALGIESIVQAAQGLNKTIMIVSQNEINSLPNHTLIIQKENKLSTIF